MITLYGFGPAFGLPDPSPFVMKAEVLLKMAGLSYRIDTTGFRRAPKGKLPYIRDDDRIIADSTFIRFYLEERYGVDFDRGLSPAERGTAWAVEKLCEDHLYWLVVHLRWMDDAEFARGPARFFDGVPAPVRPLIRTMVRRQLRRTLWGQGTGRHSDAERTRLGQRALDAVAVILGDRPYLMGDTPCGADATAYASMMAASCPHFDSPLRRHAESLANLVDYCARLTRQYYPEPAAAAAAS